MRVKRQRQQVRVVVKEEDVDAVLPAGPISMAYERGSLPDHAPAGRPGTIEDTKPTVSRKTRPRLFVDAVVIAKRNPEARFDKRYRRMSSVVPTDSHLRASTGVKKGSWSPMPAPATRTRSSKKGSGHVKVKLEGDGEERFDHDPTTISPSVLEEPFESPLTTLQDEVRNPIKIREESPDVSPEPLAALVAPNIELADEEAVKKWKNPKAKVKKEAITLSVTSIKARLAEAGIGMDLFPIECDKDILDTSVSREFMSSKWGGSSQETFPRIGKRKLAEHGLRDFMYLPDNFQPVAPRVPGAPGIWIDENSHGEWSYGIQRVFTRIQTGPALWVYQGQYEMRQARAMTREEWAAQTPLVRNTWARELCRKGWGAEMRANIYALREWGRRPTESELEDIYHQKLFSSVSVPEVALALTRGDVTMGLYTMKCVGYDKAFAKQVMERWNTWVPPPRKPPGKRKAGGEPKAETAQKRRTKRQKLEEDVIDVDELRSDDEEGSSEGEDYGEDEQESDPDLEVQEQVYASRGTRSRPRT